MALNNELLFPNTDIIVRVILVYIILVGYVAGQDGVESIQSDQRSLLKPIEVTPFASGISHWRNIRDENRFIQAEKDQPSYQADQVKEIVDNILLFQRSNGGWPKDYDMTAILTPDQRAVVSSTRENNDASFDNGNIHSQVEYLAKAISQADDPEWQAACLQGLDFILRSQYPNGGFPQRFPSPKSYHAHITFNDGVMVGILNLLHDASKGTKPFEWLDADRRQQAKNAVDRGVQCLLKSQIRKDGKRTGWCQQHDEITLEARPARKFELASICPQETTEIVRFLMRQPSPSSELIDAADSAIAWLESVRLNGIRVDRVRSTPESFLRHDTDIDVVVVVDPNAKSLWARHYEIQTDRPIFAGRDGMKKYELASIERERRTGTAWYGGWPSLLIEREYPKWKKEIDSLGR
ncbi:MAG: pectate lyase [Pirellulaceae bacterium]|nr:pectate lyase [Pirellulaceae bacterium]